MSQGRASYYLVRFAGAVLPFIPRRLGYLLADVVGYLLYYFNPRSRANLISNLRQAIGPKMAEERLPHLARQVFQNAVKNYYELFHHRWTPVEKLLSYVQVEGVENVQRALAGGKGMVLVSLHLGSPEAFLQIAPLFGYPITAAVEPLQPPTLMAYMLRLRQRHGIKLIPADGPLFSLFRALKNNQIVALAIDRDVTGSGTAVQFFGAPVRLADGPVQLALRTGAALCLGHGVRRPDNTFQGIVEPPLQLEVTGDRRRDIEVNMQKVASLMEKIIRRHPEQWLMFQPLWGKE
ncbi:MAG: hypothetical protein HYX86_06180 [Chloroflexi bacterium]|nr:hypothetical protein [Chloroflexota bacterium]